MNNSIFEEDIKNIINDFDMSVFDGKTILVTGATGLIGKLCVKSLLNSGYNTQVIALVRDEEKAKNIFGESKRLTYLVQDINQRINTTRRVDYIIHAASTTSSKDFVEKPVETIYTAINGSRNVLEFAKNKQLEGMVYLSSLEIYGVNEKENIKERDYGYIDILNPRSSYSESKKMVETMCISYGTEYGVPVKIARLAQTFGAGVSISDNRVFAQFAKAIINKENIILHTKGETKRNYCYTTDAVRGIFTILTKGENNNAYNVANENSYCSISEMAHLLENEYTKVEYKIDEVNRGYNPTVKIALNTEKLNALGWEAKVNLKEMFDRLIMNFGK